jgi:hypothetical protein
MRVMTRRLGRWDALAAATLLLAAACMPAAAPPQPGPATPGTPVAPAGATSPARPLPYPVVPDSAYRLAVARGTRTATGAPGPGYWQQWADYRLTARIDAAARRLDGTAEIVYHNRSPDALAELHVDLHQNLHAPGAIRLEPAEVTGGVQLGRVAVGGRTLAAGGTMGPRYRVLGTRLVITPPAPVPAGGTVTLHIDWSFAIPQAGAGARMGWHEDNLFFLAYWYPQMTVYDDVVGWHPDPFLAVTEFYAGFANYDVTIDAPAQWVVQATGRQLNREQTLAPALLERLRRAESSDEVVTVKSAADFGRATVPGAAGRVQWRFRADTVRDFAFSATRASQWDAARAAIGDRDGDGRTDHTVVHAFWRATAPRWAHVARYQQHALGFLSDLTAIPYPWPHMSAVEGGGIIGGGMEFPMMTLIGDYNLRGDSALYSVTAHELAHMWVPMIVSSDERRYSWLDEGHTTFHTGMAFDDFFGTTGRRFNDQLQYVAFAGSDREVEMMRWSAYIPPPAFVIANYRKPASVLHALRGVLGEETFLAAHREFLRRWAYRHPYPWDYFRTVEAVSGRDLGWFWRSWYYETWVLDQAVAAVTAGPGGTTIVIEDRGWVPMPVHLAVTRADGATERIEVPVDVWLAGATRTEVRVAPGTEVTRVEIDAAHLFPDVDRANNVWPR